MKTLEKGHMDKDFVQVIEELSNGYIKVYKIIETVEDPGSGLVTIKIDGKIDKLIKGAE